MYIATMNLSGPIQTILYGISDIQRSKDIRNKVFRYLEEKEDHYSYVTAESVSSLVVENLSKSNQDKILFEDVFIEVSNPGRVLIKGKSGSGKSTLLKIIAGKIDPDGGRVYLRTNKDEKLANFQGNLAYISQHPFFCHGTIRDNLTLGQDFTDKELNHYLNLVGLTDEIPDTLNYHLQNNGENLSGGQRLRLELVRCLMRNKEIILADEITSALDKSNARRIRSLLAKLPIILIEVAHYLDTEISYDQIIDLESYQRTCSRSQLENIKMN